MKRIILAIVISTFAAGSALAASCDATAMSKDGKALTGAAKMSYMKKCCADSAMGKDGKPLAGAAKKSYMEKCEKGG